MVATLRQEKDRRSMRGGNVTAGEGRRSVMASIEIRRAGVADLDLLMEWRMMVLREVFCIPENGQIDRMDRLERANRAYYEAALPGDGHVACFAYDGEEIVGCGGICIYQEMPSPDNPTGMCAYLMNIYTRPTSRGRGIGEAVVRWLVGQAKQRGITKVYLETSGAGRKLYEKVGFSDMEDMMQMDSELFFC